MGLKLTIKGDNEHGGESRLWLEKSFQSYISDVKTGAFHS